MPQPWEKPQQTIGNPWDRPADELPSVPKAPIPAGLQPGSQSGPGLTGIDPHQMPHSMSELGFEGLRALSNIGGGGIGALATMGRLTAVPDLLMGKPTIYQDAYHAMTNPKETAKEAVGAVKSMAAHPLETIEQGIGAAGAGALIPEGANLLNRLPSKSRAGAVLQDIRQAAKDVPVAPTNAWPEVERFKDLVAAGGKGSRPISQLSKRMTNIVRNPDAGSFNFPEARDFYSNVSDASHASTLSKLMGTAPKPVMLRQLGSIRNAFNEDLANAAQKVGRGEDYANAMSEYARAAKLRSALIKGGGMAAGAALGHSLPGKVLSKFIPTH